MTQLSNDAARFLPPAAYAEVDVASGAFAERDAGNGHDGAFGWTIADDCAGSVEIDDHPGGTRLSLHQVTSADAAVVTSASMPIRSGFEYAAQAKAMVTAGAVGMRLTFTDSTGGTLAVTTSAARRTTGRFGGLAVSATAPAEAVYASIEIHAGSGEAATANVRDVRLVTGGVVTEVGTPLHVSAIHSAVTGPWSDDRPVVYALVRGEPPTLAVLDIDTGEAIATIALPPGDGAFGAFGMAQTPERTVYVGATNGCLYSYRPGDAHAVKVMQVMGASSTFWRIATDGHGRVYGGLYPRGTVARFDPSTGHCSQVDVPGSSEYARSVAVADGVVWAGMGTPARLVRLDAETLEHLEDVPLPEGFSEAHPMVYDLAMSGRRLFIRGSDAGRIHALDLDSGTWSRRIDTGAGVDFATSPDGDVYWLGESGALRRLAATELEPADTGVSVGSDVTRSVNATGLGWAGDTLVFVDSTGVIHTYEPGSGRVRDVRADVPRNDHAIHRLTEAPDGRVYVTGFAPGGLAWYDVATGEIGECPPGSARQAEHAVYHDGRLWLGTYPGADVLVFDPNRDPDPGTNPALVARLRHVTEPAQDRPYALAGTPRGVYLGTVPHYGQLGGRLFVVPGSTALPQLVSLPDSVSEHSVTALAYDVETGSLYVGTSRCGGLGVPPADGSARVLRLSVLDHRVAWEAAPVDGALSVSSLLVRGGELWGATPGDVFAMDPATGAVRSSADIAPFPFEDEHPAWGSAKLVTGSDGRVHGQLSGQLVVFDDDPAAWTVLATDTAGGRCAVFARDDKDDSYFARGSVLYRLTPAWRHSDEPT